MDTTNSFGHPGRPEHRRTAIAAVYLLALYALAVVLLVMAMIRNGAGEPIATAVLYATALTAAAGVVVAVIRTVAGWARRSIGR